MHFVSLAHALVPWKCFCCFPNFLGEREENRVTSCGVILYAVKLLVKSSFIATLEGKLFLSHMKFSFLANNFQIIDWVCWNESKKLIFDCISAIRLTPIRAFKLSHFKPMYRLAKVQFIHFINLVGKMALKFRSLSFHQQRLWVKRTTIVKASQWSDNRGREAQAHSERVLCCDVWHEPQRISGKCLDRCWMHNNALRMVSAQSASLCAKASF